MCAPVIEFLGFVFFIFQAAFGLIEWNFFIAFFCFILSFSYVYSSFSVFMEAITYNQYKRKTDVMKLLLTAVTEPFIFHPFIVWSAIEGYIDLILKDRSWGEMTRVGFGKSKQPAAG